MTRLAMALVMVSAWLMATPVGVSTAQAQAEVEAAKGSLGRGGITCGQGRRIVERRGFRNVRTRSCRGRIFEYSGRRRGDNHWIDVRRRDGRIVSIERRRGGRGTSTSLEL